MNYEVFVSNIGKVLITSDEDCAHSEFDSCVAQTKLGRHRYSNEAVYLFGDGDLIKEHEAIEPPDAPNERD